MHVEHLIRQKSYEHLELLLRRSLVIFFGYAAVFMLLALAPAGVYLLFRALLPDVLAHPVWYPLLAVVGTIYYFSLWLFFFTEFIDYYLDVWIVTNDRIVNIEQQGLFSRTISELDLYQIQDVTSEVSGIVKSAFNFGNVHIQTAGNVQRFVFKSIPNPHEVRKHIVDLIAEDRKFHPRAA